MRLNLNRTTGFFSSDAVIRVTGNGGKVLYYFKNPERKRITFNLPAGQWQTESELGRLKNPLRYVCPPLPHPNRKTSVKPLYYSVEANPNKCSIDTKTGNVVIDNSLAKKDIPFLTFVLFHENAHFYYRGGGMNENYCDVWAACQMLKRGYNPSQIYFAQEFCLSERSVGRKDYLYNFLKQVKCYE